MKAILAIIFLMLASPVMAYNYDNCFPGKEHLLSPSHRYEFIWKEPKDDNDSHHLFYKDSKSNSKPYELLTFERSLCIHWSPDEKYFTVSDYMASNIAEDYIYKSENTKERINVIDLLPQEVRELFKGISHGYLETRSWDKNGLVIRAWGDRDKEPREFDLNLKCALFNGAWTCRKIGKD